MTTEYFTSLFEKYEDDYIQFEKVEHKRSSRPDIHAFILLNELVPGTEDMVSAAEHDEIYISIDVDKLAEAISEDQAVELIRCGVRMGDYDGLAMFV